MAVVDENENLEEGKGSKKGSKKTIIIVAVVALVLIIVIAVVLYLFVFSKSGTADNAQQQQAGQAASLPQQAEPQQAAEMDMGMVMGGSNEVGMIYDIPPFAVNLSDPNAVYLRMAVSLDYDPKNSALQKELETKLPVIQDLIIMITSAKTLEEVSTSQGKDNLKREMLRRINGKMTKGKLNNIYIRDFVIQR